MSGWSSGHPILYLADFLDPKFHDIAGFEKFAPDAVGVPVRMISPAAVGRRVGVKQCKA